MNFPILIEASDDKFEASLVGAPNVRVVEPTRSQAITSIEAEIKHHIERGDLVSLDIDETGISNLAGKYNTDPTLREICDNTYQIRNAEHHR